MMADFSFCFGSENDSFFLYNFSVGILVINAKIGIAKYELFTGNIFGN